MGKESAGNFHLAKGSKKAPFNKFISKDKGFLVEIIRLNTSLGAVLNPSDYVLILLNFIVKHPWPIETLDKRLSRYDQREFGIRFCM